MFVERFDGLMNIAELSNSQLGREISMNPSRASDGCAPVRGLCRSTRVSARDVRLSGSAPTLRVWPGENPYSGAELPDFIIDNPPDTLLP